jgi:hypothetical protein
MLKSAFVGLTAAPERISVSPPIFWMTTVVVITPLVQESVPKLSDGGAVKTCADAGLRANKQSIIAQHQKKQDFITN